MLSNENEIQQLGYENFNQKFLANSGVCVYFGNVFLPVEGQKLPVIKSKLRQILVDFGLSKTHVEISQELGSVTIWYRDPKAKELKGLLLQRFNDLNRESQALEINISLEDSVSSPKGLGEIRTYTGLTRMLYQEFIKESKVFSLADSSVMKFYSDMREIIQKGNLAASEPLQAILTEEVG